MNITVTGTRGLVGHAVAGLLTRSGHVVTRLERPAWDALAPEAWGTVPDAAEVIIHTVAAFEGQSPEDVLWKTNVTALMGLVRRSRNLPQLRHIIFCSSGAVYSPQPGPVNIETEPHPQTAYGMSKLLGETMLRHGCAVSVTSVRLFFPFGPGQKLPRLIPRLINSIRSGQAVKLRNTTGAPRVNPLPVSRAATFMAALAMEHPAASRTLNLGGPLTLSVQELSEKIGERVGRAPVFEIEAAAANGCLHCEPTEASGSIEEFESTLTTAVAAIL